MPALTRSLFILALLLPAVCRGAIVEWTIASGGNGHFYGYVDAPTTWNEAVTLAASMSHNGMAGYLATITSDGENNFIIANFNRRGWLGGSDAAVEGDWRWMVGPEAGQLFFQGSYPDPNRHTLIYSDWGGNEPNDSDNTQFGFPYAGEDYLQFDPARGGEWNDAPGDPFVYDGFYVEFGPAAEIPEPTSLLCWGAVAMLSLRLRPAALRRG